MSKPITNLHTIHGIRHSLVMYSIVKGRDQSVNAEWRMLVSTEMALFTAGLEILSDGRYADYVDWFLNNTPPSVLDSLKPMCQEMLNSMEEPAIDPDDIPF